MAATRTSGLTPVSDAMVKRLAWLDLSDAQRRFARGADHAASVHPAWDSSVEYRRFLLLRLIYPELDVPAPPVIDHYWRLHAAGQEKFAADCRSLTHGTNVSPQRLVPPRRPAERAAGPEIRELYETTFPCGNAQLWGWPPVEPEHSTSAPALAAVHRRLPSAIDEPICTRLRQEAVEHRRRVAETHSASTSVGGSRANRPIYWWCADHSPALHEVHWKGTVPRLIVEQTGVIVSPSSAGYIYYRSGDFVGIHTDGYGCDLVVLTLLSGTIEPLHCHLHLTDTPREEIRDLAKATNGTPEGGTPFDISAVPFLLCGQRIPHHRAPLERDNETIVMAQFYTPLVPPRADAVDLSSRGTRSTAAAATFAPQPGAPG